MVETEYLGSTKANNETLHRRHISHDQLQGPEHAGWQKGDVEDLSCLQLLLVRGEGAGLDAHRSPATETKHVLHTGIQQNV